jgi:hypothetical protein
MNLRRSSSFVALAIAAAAAIAFFGSTTQSAPAIQSDPNSCQVSVSGHERPELLPAQDVWEKTFTRHLAAPKANEALGLSRQSLDRLTADASKATERARALRDSLSTAPSGVPKQVAQDRDLVIVDAILDARDDAVRQLSDEDLAKLNDFAEDTARTMQVVLPVAGQRQSSEDGARVCELIVTGRTYPHLLPEHQVWTDIFEVWGRVAVDSLQEHGQFPDTYVETVRRSMIKIPPADVRRFLQVAAYTSVELKRLKSSPPAQTIEESRQRMTLLRRTALAGRSNLLRSMSVESWQGLVRYADGFRLGMKFWYRSEIGG